MAQSVKLSDDVMGYIRRESALQSRSVAGQIAHWVKIGRAIEQSDNFTYSRVRATLDGALNPDELTAEEQEVWFDQFADELADPIASETEFYAHRRQLGRGVGLDESGTLVHQAKGK